MSSAASGTPTDEEGRRRVVWDEMNLAANEEYRKLHPVTMKIDEPKTPYEPSWQVEDEPEFHEAMAKEEEQTWDPKINELAHKVKLTQPVTHFVEVPVKAPAPEPQEEAPEKPKKKLRAGLALAVDVDEDAAKTIEETRRLHEFKNMRRAVYADEGKNFKALLGAKPPDDEDDEDEEEEKK